METVAAALPTNLASAPAGIELLSRKPPGVETEGASISVLLVSPFLDDQETLEQFLRPPKWSIYRAPTLKSAMAAMELERLPLVLCERDLGQDAWKNVLAQTMLMLHSPLIIVTSRLADEHLWAEALNLGAYDVLAKPFDATEVTRILSLAWVHWCIHNDAAQWPARFKTIGA
jgi:DNA-binding NtrC family response regulator